MKHEIINIVTQYRDGDINSTEAMNSIVRIIFPEIYKDDIYIKKLIAFMWDVEYNKLTGSPDKTTPYVYARIMYTWILKEKYKITSIELGRLLQVKPNAVRSRFIAHTKHMTGFPEYKKIYNLVSKVL